MRPRTIGAGLPHARRERRLRIVGEERCRFSVRFGRAAGRTQREDTRGATFLRKRALRKLGRELIEEHERARWVTAIDESLGLTKKIDLGAQIVHAIFLGLARHGSDRWTPIV